MKKIHVNLKNKKQSIGFFGIFFSLACMLVLFGTVWHALLFGNGVFSVTLVRFNEGLLEFFLMPFLVIFCIYGLYRYYCDVLRKGDFL